MRVVASIVILLMLMHMFSEVSKRNLIGISKLRQFALKDDDHVQCNGASGFDIQDNNDKVLNCNGIVDVSAAFM